MSAQNIQTTHQRRNQICRKRWHPWSRGPCLFDDSQMRHCPHSIRRSQRRNLFQPKKLLSIINREVDQTIRFKIGQEELNRSSHRRPGPRCWNRIKINELDEIDLSIILWTLGLECRCHYHRQISKVGRYQREEVINRLGCVLHHQTSFEQPSNVLNPRR